MKYEPIVIKILVMIGVFILSTVTVSHAETEITEGYDENTEITVKGTVVEVIQRMKGPVIIRLNTEARVYRVVTAPRWYLLRNSIVFGSETPLEVTGSKYFSKDGNLYIIARQLRDPVTKRITLLRDSFCRPLWKMHRFHRVRD